LNLRSKLAGSEPHLKAQFVKMQLNDEPYEDTELEKKLLQAYVCHMNPD